MTQSLLDFKLQNCRFIYGTEAQNVTVDSIRPIHSHIVAQPVSSQAAKYNQGNMKNQSSNEKPGRTNLLLVGGLITTLLLLLIGGWYLFGLVRLGGTPVEPHGAINKPTMEIPQAIPENEPGTPTPSFLDDFEDGLDPVWAIHYGDPFIVNGRLTSNIGAGIAAGDVTWRNYRVDFYVDATQSDCAFSESSNSIGVRVADFDHAYWFVLTSCEAGWSLFPGGVLRGEVNMFPDTRVGAANEAKHITIRVEDTEMSVLEDGLPLSSIEDSSFETGGVFLQLEAGTFYDNFEVTLLP